MMTTVRQTVRCAIYTRVSTESGLDQDFNSLDAQYDAAQAYIRSQAQAGWALARTRYDDGGFSGGSTDRPALQQLLADIRAHRINVIVVYKVDRLTRSLADFAKLVELFDTHGVSFVSVTQQFNTTTSMGRLTLNVLLSFAQFEREVTSERIRDKIGASKRKGLWVGGVVPLGYQAKDRKITVVEQEAKTVRHIFRRYLELGSLNLLLADLRTTGVRTKVRPLSSGRTIGGIPFTRGSLASFLRNRFYIGEVKYKGEVFPGEQTAILDRTLFDSVQTKLDQQRTNHTKARQQSDSLMMGRIFDERGNRMTPTYAVKKGVRYRYYISAALIQGQSDKAAKLNRVPAAEIEKVIISAVRKHFREKPHNVIGAEGPNTITKNRIASVSSARRIPRSSASKDASKDHISTDLDGDHAWEVLLAPARAGRAHTQHIETALRRAPGDIPGDPQIRIRLRRQWHGLIGPAAIGAQFNRSDRLWAGEGITGQRDSGERSAHFGRRGRKEACHRRRVMLGRRIPHQRDAAHPFRVVIAAGAGNEQSRVGAAVLPRDNLGAMFRHQHGFRPL